MALSVSVLTRFDCKTEIIWYFGCFWESVKAITTTSQGHPMDICPSKYLFFSASDDPNVLWADWKTKFLDVVWTRRARIKKAPWINSELKKGMRDLDATKRKAMASNGPRDWANYKKLRNTINNNIKTSKASYCFKSHYGSWLFLMLLVNLKVILEKHGKPLTNLLPVAPTIQRWKNWSWMVPLFLILVGFLMLLMTIFQQLDPALPMKFLKMIIIMS